VLAISTRLLLILGLEGKVVRGRPRGSWISSQYRWSPLARWLPDGLSELATMEAEAALVRLWLGAFGPGTVTDLRWWTGWTTGQVRRALAAIQAVEVGLDGEPGFVLAGDAEPSPATREPWIALLPALDPTVMGWQGRDWYLGPHRPMLFDTNGNAGPTVWSDGRVVGGWSQRRTGEVPFRLLEDVGREKEMQIAAEADRLRAWIGDVRVTPRFRTPLERDLMR
jgi:hypothetical protein